MQKIIRIDKGDGAEEEVDRDLVARVVTTHARWPRKMMDEFDSGQRIETPFAYYELREVEEAK